MAKGWSAILEGKRNKGDEWADRLVAEVVDAGGEEEQGEVSMGQLISQIVRVHETVPDDLPQDMKDYFLKEDRPAWVDANKIKLGTDVFVRHGVEISMILLCASLPACYADAPGINALDITHQLTKHPLRRVIETSRFVIDVLLPGNLLDNGHGAITAKKVRLLHATNRRILHKNPHAPWKEAEWGLPLNQEDLALTLMTFATVVLDSLEKLNLHVSPKEQEGYLHAWRYIGYLMGIEEELLPHTVASGRALYKTIARRVYASSPAGIALTKALVNMMQDILPGRVVDGVIPAKIRLYLGDKVADMLDVKKVSPHSMGAELLDVVKFVHGLEHRFLRDHQIFGFATDSLGRLILHGLEDYERKDNRPQFHIPTLLREKWNLAPKKSDAHEHAVVTSDAHPVAPADKDATIATIAATTV